MSFFLALSVFEVSTLCVERICTLNDEILWAVLKFLTSCDFQQFINALLLLVCINTFFVIPAEIQHMARASVLLALLSIRCFVIQGFFCTWLMGPVQVIQINIGRNKMVYFRWQFMEYTT